MPGDITRARECVAELSAFGSWREAWCFFSIITKHFVVVQTHSMQAVSTMVSRPDFEPLQYECRETSAENDRHNDNYQSCWEDCLPCLRRRVSHRQCKCHRPAQSLVQQQHIYNTLSRSFLSPAMFSAVLRFTIRSFQYAGNLWGISTVIFPTDRM